MVKKTIDGEHAANSKGRHKFRKGLKSIKGKARRPERETSFVIEPLEPRILFSADLAPAAQTQILTGLADLHAGLNGVNALQPATNPIAFIDRPAADFAKLGDPLTSVQSAAQNYFTANQSTATLEGLAAALNAIPNSNVQASIVTLQGGGEQISLNMAQVGTATTAATLTGETNTSLTLANPQSANITATNSLNLQFGVNTGQFVVSGSESEHIQANGNAVGRLDLCRRADDPRLGQQSRH